MYVVCVCVCVCVWCEMAYGLTAKGRIGQPFKGEKGRYSTDKKNSESEI